MDLDSFLNEATTPLLNDKEPFVPLYTNATTSVCGALSMVMAFSSRHKLSLTGVADLLNLLKLLCPTPNNIPGSLYKFCQHFQNFQGGYKRTIVCSECHSPLTNSRSRCLNHSCGQISASYLVHLPIQKPLETIVSSKYTVMYMYIFTLNCTACANWHTKSIAVILVLYNYVLPKIFCTEQWDHLDYPTTVCNPGKISDV